MKRKQIQNKIGCSGKYRITTFKAGTKDVVRQSDWIDNMIVSSSGYGLNLIARLLANDNTYPLTITQAKIGDDNTAVVVGDTDLGNTLVGGILVANQVVADNVVTFLFFMSDSELPDDTYEEFGIFCTNQMFARSVISPAYTKSTLEDTQVDYELTFTSV